MAFIDHMKFAQCPNPIYWLEAELDDESGLKKKALGFQVMRPWKGLVRKKAVLAAVDWEFLLRLEWEEIDAIILDSSFQG